MSILVKNIKSKYILLGLLVLIQACSSMESKIQDKLVINSMELGVSTAVDVEKKYGAPAKVENNKNRIVYYYFDSATGFQTMNFYFDNKSKLTKIIWMPDDIDLKRDFPTSSFVEKITQRITPGLIEEEKTLEDKTNGISLFYLNNHLEAVIKYIPNGRTTASKK